MGYVGEDNYTYLYEWEKRFVMDNDLIKSSLNGGLVLGNFHTAHLQLRSGVKGFVFTQDNRLRLSCEIEGWEYILNEHASVKYAEEIKFIFNEFENYVAAFEPYVWPSVTPIIDCRNPTNVESKFLAMEVKQLGAGQAIISKHATKKYINELNEMNLINS